MRISSLCFDAFCFFLPPALICTVCLYLYPALVDCSFPNARSGSVGCAIPGSLKDAVPTEIAPFRLLALGDPQLEGDTSLPNPNVPAFPSLRTLGTRVKRGRLHTIPFILTSAAGEVITRDIPKIVQGYRKRLDLWGNDLYLAHIYRSISWWADPTHTVVLGDLLGSQHISDEEFGRRRDRFWHTVFAGSEKVPRTVTDVSGRSEVLGKDDSWKSRVIAVAGNHDIGYAGDISEHRVERFEEAFGSVNWDIRFKLEGDGPGSTQASALEPSTVTSVAPELRLVILNSMNLDEPAKDPNLQNLSREFIRHELYRPRDMLAGASGTVLLTHIPFHKEAGICADGPFFDYFLPHEGGGVKEQNHLSEPSSDYILNGLTSFGKPENAIVLNGHDHEGCDTYHYRSLASFDSKTDEPGVTASPWQAKHHRQSASEIANNSLLGIREITVRSMMGSFGGNAGLLSAWFDNDTQEWRFEYSSCRLGVQHIWWGVHVLDLVVITFGFASLFTFLWEDMRWRTDLIVKQEGPKMKGD